jgi:RNA polymerase sigma factor (sigma-70 family)
MTTRMTSAPPPAAILAGHDGTITSSWDEIARTHAARVYAHAYWLTGNRPDAEDLAHDVFVRAFHALPTTTPRNLGGWLRQITHNLHLDLVRRQQRIHFVALPELDAQALVDARPDPAEALGRHTLSP